MSVFWYDKQGKPLNDMDVIERKLGEVDYKRVAYTEVGAYNVSTVWLGLDHDYSHLDHNKVNPRPVIFETMVFENAESTMEPLEIAGKTVFNGGMKYHKSLDDGDFTSRYCTEAEAKAGHEATVQRLKEWLARP